MTLLLLLFLYFKTLTNSLGLHIANKFNIVLSKQPDLNKNQCINHNQECGNDTQEYFITSNITPLNAEWTFPEYKHAILPLCRSLSLYKFCIMWFACLNCTVSKYYKISPPRFFQTFRVCVKIILPEKINIPPCGINILIGSKQRNLTLNLLITARFMFYNLREDCKDP